MVMMATGPALAAGTFLDNLAGVDVSAEGGYLIGNGDLPYAQYDDHVKDYAFKVGPGSGWSGKFELNGRFESGWNISASYMHSETTKSAATPSFNSTNTPVSWPVWNVLGFQNDSGSSGATSYNSATVSTKVHADVIDFEAAHDVGLGIDGDFMLLGGLRIADYEQRTSMDLFCSQPPGSTSGSGCTPRELEVAQNRGSRFSGFGPQVGAKYSVPVSDWGIGFFSSGIVSALLGKQETNTTSLFDGDSPTLSHFHDHHVAFTFDARAGLSYTMPNCPMIIALGYQVSWMNGVRDSQNEASASGSSASFGSPHADLLYHGPFLRLTYSPL